MGKSHVWLNFFDRTAITYQVRSTMKKHFEKDDAAFPADAYKVRGSPGVAWYVYGWETEPTEDTEWDGIEERTGKVVCVMVGDDSRFAIDLEDLTPLAREDYCGCCGQIGCSHDGLERD